MKSSKLAIHVSHLLLLFLFLHFIVPFPFLPSLLIQDVNMSTHLGRRLYSHLWESASPFLGRIRPNRIATSSSRRSLARLSTPTKPTYLTRRVASGGFFVLGISPTSTVAESSAACILPSKKLAAQYVWKRAVHNTSTPNDQSPGKNKNQPDESSSHDLSDDKKQSNVRNTDNIPPQSSSHPPHFIPSNRHLMDRLPHMPHLHRPTKEELLAAATGFWSRLKVRFKWFSIRSVRPFSLDEIAALFSWVLLGHIVWIVVGTTTFFSLLILAINTVFAQGKTIAVINLPL